MSQKGFGAGSRTRRCGLVFLVAVAGCLAGAPPAHWARGGAPLDVPRGRWTFGEAVTEIDGDGRVRLNGEPVFTVDAAGRVFDGEAAPLALLELDGRVVGPDEANLGSVGVVSASLAGHGQAWISVAPSGEVTRFDEDGGRHPFGVWVGECNRSPSAAEVCTLVTHLVGMRVRARGGASGGLSIGVGIGVH